MKPVYVCLILHVIDLGFILKRKRFILTLGWHHTRCPEQYKCEGHSAMLSGLKEGQSLEKTDM